MSAEQASRHDQRRDMMLYGKISRIIPALAVPTIISMLITSFYSIADTFFVSQIGKAATAAAGINFSLMSLIQSAGMSFGVGAASYISRLLGAKKDEEASRALSTAFLMAVVTGALIMIFGHIFMLQLVKVMGATPDIIKYSTDFARWMLYAAPFMAGSFVLNQGLRAEGSATFSMIGIGSGTVLNLILAPIFIFACRWEVAGAAAATAISQVVSFTILLVPFIRKRSLLKLSPRLISFKKTIIAEIAKMGFPTLIRTLLMTVSSVVTNQFAGGFSTSALAAISVVNRFMMFMGSALIGFGQGFQPVAGFNWGAKRYDRVWSSFKFCSNIGIFGMAILCTIIAIVAPQIMGAFSKDATVIAIGSFSIRLQCLSMPIQAWVIVVNMLFQSMGRATSAAILGLSRQGICFIPAVIVMSLVFGVWGLAAAQAVADGLSLALAFPLAFKVLKEIKRLMAENPVSENSSPAVETAQ